MSPVKPYGFAIHDGKIYVCDSVTTTLHVFDFKDKDYQFMGLKGRGKVRKAINITIDEKGRKYVADIGRKQVIVFDENDNYLDAFGSEDLGKPTDVAIYQDKLFVCDAEKHIIRVWNKKDGAPLYNIGGGKDGIEFSLPTNIAIDQKGDLYVSDQAGRVWHIDKEGKLVKTFGSLGDAVGQFARPKGIDVDREGRIYVVDAAFEKVQLFNNEGQLLMFFGDAGGEPYHINLPAQVVVDYDHLDYFKKYVNEDYELENLILVSSQYGLNKINVFGLIHEKAGRQVAKEKSPETGEKAQEASGSQQRTEKKQEVTDKPQEAAGKGQETGDRKQETEDKGQEAEGIEEEIEVSPIPQPESAP